MTRYADTRGPAYAANHRKAALAYQKRKREAGLCVQCGKPATGTTQECDVCAETTRESGRERHVYAMTQRCGLCRELGHNRRTCDVRWEAD